MLLLSQMIKWKKRKALRHSFSQDRPVNFIGFISIYSNITGVKTGPFLCNKKRRTSESAFLQKQGAQMNVGAIYGF